MASADCSPPPSFLLFRERLEARGAVADQLRGRHAARRGAPGVASRSARHPSTPTVLATSLGGILTFFILEKLVLWRHCHTDDCRVHGCCRRIAGADRRRVPQLRRRRDDQRRRDELGAARVNPAVGCSAHEIPQEVGDLAILLAARLHPWPGVQAQRPLRRLPVSRCDRSSILPVEQLPRLLPYRPSFAAGGLLYVAMSDLIPGLHRTNGESAGSIRQIFSSSRASAPSS